MVVLHHFDGAEPLLPDLLDGHAKWRATRPAVRFEERSLTWGEFGAAAHRTARSFLNSGVVRGDRVAVLMDNSIEMIETLFGALRAGACVVPLNTSVADAAIEAMIKDCSAVAVIASGAHIERLQNLSLPTVRCRVAASRLSTSLPSGWIAYDSWQKSGQSEVSFPAIGPDDLSNIIYSSGTTGIPKGIVHDHGRRASWARSLALALRYDSRAIGLCSIGLYSNISWVTMLCTLVVGGCIVIERGFDVEKTLNTIGRYRVTHGSFVPVIVQRLLESGKLQAAELISLRALMCCGSPLPLELKKRALHEFGCDFIELYGLTEGVITTLDPEDAANREMSVGLPLPGTEIRIIDEDGRVLAANEAGEIVSRGHITMVGYFNRPDATAESTWIDSNGFPWLRTGDIGRIDETGFLYIVDRKKDMIISGGQNVYPTDIESVILDHPEVAEAAVIGIPSARWGESPYAIVVPKQKPVDPDVLETQLRDWVNQRVGKQQRVAGLRLVTQLPRNPNGKVLKRELRREFSSLAN